MDETKKLDVIPGIQLPSNNTKFANQSSTIEGGQNPTQVDSISCDNDTINSTNIQNMPLQS